MKDGDRGWPAARKRFATTAAIKVANFCRSVEFYLLNLVSRRCGKMNRIHGFGGGYINNRDLAVDSYTTGRLDGLDEDGGDAIMTLEGLLSGCFPIIWVLGGVGYLLQCGWLTRGRAPELI
jgi:hypothetical protein